MNKKKKKKKKKEEEKKAQKKPLCQYWDMNPRSFVFNPLGHGNIVTRQ